MSAAILNRVNNSALDSYQQVVRKQEAPIKALPLNAAAKAKDTLLIAHSFIQHREASDKEPK